jgi:gas vesicle protein
MLNDNQELNKYHNSNVLGVFVGLLVGGLAGAVTMLLLAPQSGKDTRLQIQGKGIELRGRATEMVEDTMAQLRSSKEKITIGGRQKARDLIHQGQALAAGQLDNISEAAQAAKKAIESSQV